MQVVKRAIGLAGVLALVLNAVVFAQDDNAAANQLVVTNVTEIELDGSISARMGAYLAPDGSQYALTAMPDEICFFSLPDNVQTVCGAMPEDSFPDPGTITWSPDSRYVALIDNTVLRSTDDSDILLIDSQDGTVTNLTDDGYTGSILSDLVSAMIDLEPRWVDDTTIAFLRYRREVYEEALPAELYTVSVDGGDPELMRVLTLSKGTLDVYVMDWLVGTQSYAVSLNQMQTPIFGIMYARDGAFPVPVNMVNTRGSRQEGIWAVSISSDGQYVFSVDRAALERNLAETEGIERSPVQVTNTTTLKTELITSDHPVSEAGWSPQGNGLLYIVRYGEETELNGLYLTPAIGEPGTQLLPGRYQTPVVNAIRPIMWASNNTTLLYDSNNEQLLLIELGTE